MVFFKGIVNNNEELKRSNNTNKESKDSIDKINSIVTNSNLKKVVVSESCVACGICTLQTNLLKENPDGKVSAVEPGIVSEENISLIERVISECPVKAISLVKYGLVNGKGKEGLKELIEFIKNKLYNYKVDFPLPEEYEFNKTEFQTPTAYGTGEYSYEYSSDDRAIRAGLREFDRVIYSQRRAIIQQLLVEYKTKKLNKYSYYENKKENFYYSTNKKIENLLKEIIEEAKELSNNNILFPNGFEKFEVIPKFGIDGDDFNKELIVYQLRHIEELWFVQDIMNELEPLNWYDTYIDTDYMEDYRERYVYCYKNINDVCNKFGEHLINEFPYVLNGSDGIRKIIEAPISKYIEQVNKEIKIKAGVLIDLIEKSLKSKPIKNVNLKNELKESTHKIKKNNKSKDNIKNFKNKKINFDGEKYWCICPHCEVNKIILEGIVIKNIYKKIYFKKSLRCDLCEGTISSFINPIIVKQPKSVFFKCINTKCNQIIEVNGKNCTEYNNKIIFDVATKCTLCGINIGEIDLKNIFNENVAKKLIKTNKQLIKKQNDINVNNIIDDNANKEEKDKNIGNDIKININEYNSSGYNKYGFNKLGKSRWGTDYNHRGFNKDGFHLNGTKYDSEGYDIEGYDKYGFNKKSIHKSGNLYDEHGYNKDGYDKHGYDRNGYDKNGFNKIGYDRQGYNKEGYNKNEFNKLGYNREGYNKEGYNKFGFNKEGYDKQGYDKEGYNSKGYNRKGYNKYGFNKLGKSRWGTEYNDRGFNKNGFHLNGTRYDASGLDIDGYDSLGYNVNGYDRNGFSKKGIHINGTRYDASGYDKDGYNKYGYYREISKDNCEKVCEEKNNYELIKQDIKLVMYRSNEDDAYAQYILGEYYYNGIKVNKDINKAIEYFNMAIINGSIDAITSLGVYYYHINNFEYAIKLFERASCNGEPRANFFLGMFYEDGIGVERNYNEALKFYNRAISGYYKCSNQGDPIAKQRLGTMYYNGKGIKRDIEKAITLTKESANGGWGLANNILITYMILGDYR